MKKITVYLCIVLFFIAGASTLSGCNKDAHCPAYKSLQSKSSKKGLSTKPGKSSLFPKGMR